MSKDITWKISQLSDEWPRIRPYFDIKERLSMETNIYGVQNSLFLITLTARRVQNAIEYLLESKFSMNLFSSISSCFWSFGSLSLFLREFWNSRDTFAGLSGFQQQQSFTVHGRSQTRRALTWRGTLIRTPSESREGSLTSSSWIGSETFER